MRRFVLGLALIGATSSCGEEAGTYDLPFQEAYARLLNADTGGFRTARQCGILIHISRYEPSSDSVGWSVSSSGEPMLHFAVRLIDLGNGKTRAMIEVPADPKGGEPYDGTKLYRRPALHQPLRPAVQELIDAAMAQRPYDVWRIPEPRNSGENEGACSVQRAGLEQNGKPIDANESLDRSYSSLHPDKPGDDAKEHQP